MALAKMGPSAAPAAPVLFYLAATNRSDDGWKVESDALVNMGASAAPVLEQALCSKNRRIRFFAVYMMGRIAVDPGGRVLRGASSVIPGLKRSLKDPDAEVRAVASSELARIQQGKR